MKIILVDDHTLFRRGLRGLIEHQTSHEVVAEASSGEEFLELLRSTTVDLVFMDISMDGISGDVATRRALELYPSLKVITLSMFGDESYYKLMVEAGAKGFLLKDSEIHEVIEAIEAVGGGGNYFSNRLFCTLTTNMHSVESVASEEEILSNREREILVAVCQGLSNHEIADKLFISKRTVDKHRANIMEKTGCKNTANLVVYAVRSGMVDF